MTRDELIAAISTLNHQAGGLTAEYRTLDKNGHESTYPGPRAGTKYVNDDGTLRWISGRAARLEWGDTLQMHYVTEWMTIPLTDDIMDIKYPDPPRANYTYVPGDGHP